MKDSIIILISLAVIIIGCNQTHTVYDPKIPMAVELRNLRLSGNVLEDKDLELITTIVFNVDADASLYLNCPKHIKPLNKEKQLTKKIKAKKGEIQTVSIKLKAWEKGSSLIEATVVLDEKIPGFVCSSSQHINIEMGMEDYTIYSSTERDSAFYGQKFKKHKHLYAKRGNSKIVDTNKTSKLKSARVRAINAERAVPRLKSGTENYTFNIGGKVGSVNQSTFPWSIEGLYNSKIYLKFMDSDQPNQTYHPVMGDVEHATFDKIHENGDFQFSFSVNADLSAYDQLLLLPGASNTYVTYNIPSGYVEHTDQGELITFGASEGAALPFDPNSTTTNYSSVDIEVNRDDGILLRSMELAGEFAKERYNGSPPFSIPAIPVYKDSIVSAGYFQPHRYKVWDFWPFSYHWEYDPHIVIDFNYTLRFVTTHEFGHYAHHQMVGYEDMTGSSLEVTEGWAIFYSFAARQYATGRYMDNLENDWENTEIAPFDSPRFNNIIYAQYHPVYNPNPHPEYAAFACYLWNLYDSYADGHFISPGYNGDNDDVSNQGLRVFNTMCQMEGDDDPGDFNNMFQGGLATNLQASTQYVYGSMIVDSVIRMRSAQIANVVPTLKTTAEVGFAWSPQTYPTAQAVANRENGYRLYRQVSEGYPWTLVSTVPNSAGTCNYATANADKYNYKLTSYNESGNSFGETVFNYAYPSLQLSISGPTSIACYGTENFAANAVGGTGNYSYQWYYKYESDYQWTSYYNTPNIFFFNNECNEGTLYLRCDVASGMQSESCIEPVTLIPPGKKSEPIMAQEPGKELTLYPNPAKDFVQISGLQGIPFNITIFGMSGKKTLELKNQKSASAINIANHPPGIYLVCVESANRKEWFKLVKK